MSPVGFLSRRQYNLGRCQIGDNCNLETLALMEMVGQMTKAGMR